MTYLELVNNVLRRIREEEVTSVSSNTYSKMIGDLVNDAKETVESAHDWAALRYTLNINTTAGIFNYVLTGSKNTPKALTVINDTTNVFMEYRSSAWFDNKYLVQEPVSGAPQYYTYNGVDSNGDTQIDIYPKPDKVYDIQFNAVIRGNIIDENGVVIRPYLLTNDGDNLLLPPLPVIHQAVALATRERGEAGGTTALEYFALASKYLSDAIALDAQKHPYETDWYTP